MFVNYEEVLVKKIKSYVEEYCDFLNIKEFPVFKTEFYEIDLEEADANGFCAAAQAAYNPKNDIHTLLVCKNIEMHKYVLFHELTHIFDTEVYAKNNPQNFLYVSGYTEYHASQIELLCLLNANSIYDVKQFSMEDSIITVGGNRTVKEYVYNKHNLSVELMGRDDYPKDLEMLKGAIGALYNYWGLRSICRMHAKDYSEDVNNAVIRSVMDPYLFSVTDIFMDGWFDKENVLLTYGPYSNMIMPFAKKLCR